MADDTPNPFSTAEKFATQAETGGGRTAARPGGTGPGSGLQPGSASPNLAPLGADRGVAGAPAGTGDGGAGTLSGNVTNDSMPEGGAVGDQTQPDTLAPRAGRSGT